MTTNEKMKLLEGHILQVLKFQKTKTKSVPVDLVLVNGNIILKLFKLEEYNKQEQILKGLTHQEQYSYLREEREPVYCYLPLNEIKAFNCEALEIEYGLSPEGQKI